MRFREIREQNTVEKSDTVFHLVLPDIEDPLIGSFVIRARNIGGKPSWTQAIGRSRTRVWHALFGFFGIDQFLVSALRNLTPYRWSITTSERVGLHADYTRRECIYTRERDSLY